MKRIFTLAIAALTAISSFAGNKTVLVTTTAAQSASYGSQLLIKLPKALEEGKKYTITMDVKGSVNIASDASTALGGLIENSQSANQDQWGNSADLQYISAFSLTTDWTNVSLGQTNGSYAYDRLILNIGALCGDMYVDNVKFTDEDGNTYINMDFEDGINKYASKRSWHSHVTIGEYDTSYDNVTDWGLKVSTTEAKTTSYASQVLIKLPSALETGKKYTITMDVKGSDAIAADASVALGGLIEDSQSANQDQWGNSADIQYISNFPLTTDWTNVSLGTTNGTYPYDRLILNIGALNGDMLIDNLKFTDADGNVAANLTFDDGISTASKRSWHNHVSIDKTPSDAIVSYETATTINTIKSSDKASSAKKSVKSGKLIITRGDKTFNIAGQEM